MARPKKKKEISNIQNPKIQSPLEDFMKEIRQEPLHGIHKDMEFSYQKQVPNVETESSLPFPGKLSEDTEGYTPRSRMANTREAALREKEDFIKRAIQNVNARSTGPLDIDKEWIPEGYTFMWARASVLDRPDTTNLRKLEKKGWIRATADLMPQLAYNDPLYGTHDDAYCTEVEGLVAMIRFKEITEFEDKKYLELSRSQTNVLANHMRRKDNQEINPFLVIQRSQFGNDYTNPFNSAQTTGQNFSSY